MRIKVHGLRRILVGITIFCLAVTSPGAQPARASPQAAKNLMFNLNFDTPEKVCVGQSVDIIVRASVTQMDTSKPAGRHRAFKNGSMEFRALKGGILDPTSQAIPELWYGKAPTVFRFNFYAREAGTARMTVNGNLPGVGSSENTLTFDVLEKCAWNIRGNTDMGAVINALGPNDIWEFVGSYDIAGTIKVNEDGTLSGQGTVNKFMDAFGGQVDEVSCTHVTPWQGQTTVEIEADPNAWADEGSLELQFHLAPMQVNASMLTCVAPRGGGSTEMPGYTIAAFDLHADPISAEGGTADLKFHFPNGSVEIPMELIVTPEEAGS